MRERLADWAHRARMLLERKDLSPAARSDLFVQEIVADLRSGMSESEADLYQRAGRIDYSWLGLERYWSNRTTTTA